MQSTNIYNTIIHMYRDLGISIHLSTYRNYIYGPSLHLSTSSEATSRCPCARRACAAARRASSPWASARRASCSASRSPGAAEAVTGGGALAPWHHGHGLSTSVALRYASSRAWERQHTVARSVAQEVSHRGQAQQC